MIADDLDREFAAFVAGRGTPLLRTAYLVTADQVLAEAQLVQALARTRNDWGRAEGSGSPETYVLQHLLATKARVNPLSFLDPAGPEPAPEPREEPAPVTGETSGGDEQQDRELLWAAFRELTPAQRGVLVLGLHESMDDEQIAHLVGRSARATAAEITRALSWLRTLADPPGHRSGRPITERLGELLQLRAQDVRAEPDLAERALVQAGRLRGRRRRRVLAGTAVAAAVVAALVLGNILTTDDQGDTAGNPGASPGGSGGPSPSVTVLTPGAERVVAVPDAVLRLALDQGALVGYQSVIVDGASQPLSALVVDADPGTGASQGGTIVRLSRAEGGYVVLVRPTTSPTTPETWKLSYFPRTGTPVELARVDYQAPGFAVGADGLSVVHVVYGGADRTGELGAGQSVLVVQALSGAETDRLQVSGRATPLSVEADRVWFTLAGSDSPGLYVWDRSRGRTFPVELAEGDRPTSFQLNAVAATGRHGSRCDGLYDVADPRSPRLLWRVCLVRSAAVLDPTGQRAAIVQPDQPVLSVVEAGSGDPLGFAALPTTNVRGLAWTPNGLRLLVQYVQDGELSVASVAPPTAASPVIGDQTTYPIGPLPVVFGQELPLP